MKAAAQVCLLLALAGCAADPAERHLFYLHGQVVEGSGGRPEHPQYGVYDYPAIVTTLESRGFTVHSEIREFDTDGMAYAGRLAEDVRRLLDSGVPPDHITVVGASKGGGIALAAASKLQNEGINYVIMGTCVNWIRDWPELHLRGRILSVVEDSDTVAGPCAPRFETGDIVPLFREITIRTGRGHGAFYEPLPEWVGPVVDWADPWQNPARDRIVAESP